MQFNKEDLIKSPLNYTGGKYKLLPQILPYFPDNINTFYDLFCGGCNVGINIKANRIICTDIENHIINLFKELNTLTPKEALNILENTINKYKLSKTNREGYNNLRNDYNNGNNSWDMFYAMLTNCFNYQIRFNSKGEFNMPFGKDRSSFNDTLKKNFIKFVNELHNKNIYFENYSFKDLDLDLIKNDDFIYCDPPYLVTCASYNEKDGWNEILEKDLLHILDELNNKNVKFALSNVLENKGKSNDILKEWSKKYKVIHLNNTYGNCNYHAKDKSKNSTDEVLIINY